MVRRAVFLWLGLGIFFGFQAELCRAGTEEDLTEKQFVCPFPERTGDVLSLTYAQILGDAVPVYGQPQDERAGVAPVRITRTGFMWVSLSDTQPIMVDGQGWYKINEREYLRADKLRLAKPSNFQGVLVPRDFDKKFAWMIFHTRVSPGPGVPPVEEEDPAVVPARSLVIVHETREVEQRKWCRIGTGVWVPYNRLAMVIPALRPQEVGESERWIEVNLTEQTLSAYEGDRLIFATLVSSGDERFPTIKGLFRIWAKVRIGKMSGGEGDADRYYVEDVPWHMYFHQSYGLHTSYWHDFFGLPNSHGCVNLAPKDALWLFEWTRPKASRGNWQEATKGDPGTWVWVHETPVAMGE
ncbi:MAG: murein L,D-transpeptidase [Deltaproteobacteria bacterium]|uniref:L,D-transpeptidase n=1 Tax=Hydrosulfovibrio ferrireducens TaxID=2934181 RepID=UPI00121E6042|nr:MAG: murein L,D-transpeptidase [Deltaproteobacteria bacterium]